MRKWMIVGWMLTVSVANAQRVPSAKVPTAVRSSLATLHPAASSVKWDKEGEHYEASFVQQKTNYSVLLNGKGELMETEKSVSVGELPDAARQYLASHHPGGHIAEAAQLTTATGEITYEAEVKGRDVLFDQRGNFIKEVKK